MNRMDRALVVCLPLALLLVTGCGGKKGSLSGTVQYKSKSVVLGTVTVYDSQNRAYQGEIAEGKYTVANIPEGEVQIVVISANPAADDGGGRGADPRRPKRPGQENQPEQPKAKPNPNWFPIPAKYADQKTTPLKTRVTAGSNDYPINLVD